MYSDEFHDDPGHLRIFVPDNKDVKYKLLRAYHDSPLGMHRGRHHIQYTSSRLLLERNGESRQTLGSKMFGVSPAQIHRPATWTYACQIL